MAAMTAFKICCMQSDAGIGIAAAAARLARYAVHHHGDRMRATLPIPARLTAFAAALREHASGA